MAGRIMGTELNVKEAAEILRVSPTAVYGMRRRGVLRSTGRLRQTMMFDRDEVCALAEAKGSSSEATNEELRTALMQVTSLCSSLRRRVECLERLQGVTAAHIGVSKDEVLGLLWKVEDALKEGPMGVGDAREWSRVFLGVHEELFDLVEMYAGHPEPWRPFLELAKKAQQDCPSTGGTQGYDVAAANAELEVARRNLRQAAWVCASKRRGAAYAKAAFPETDPDPITHLLHDHMYYR